MFSDVWQLTDGPGWKANPSWSPDGSRILFTSNRTGDVELWSIKTDGDSLFRLTTNNIYDDQAEWSPAGSMVTFCGDNDIYTMSATGGNVQNLTNDNFINGAPNWSPDESEIIFHSNRNGSFDIWRIPVSGGAAIQTTFLAGDEYEPSYSPDGNYLAFSADENGNFDIWKIPIPGGNPFPITSNTANELEQNFSPDGSRIVYNLGENPTRDLWICQATGDEPQQLTFWSGDDGSGTWSPDGSKIAFHSNRSGEYEIWIMDVELISSGKIIYPDYIKLTNFPNPFNPTTTIQFSIGQNEQYELQIYNVKGQEIRKHSIFNNQSSITWNGTDQNEKPVSSGIYYSVLKQNGKILTAKKMILMK